ncbi:MAG: glycosyltransferase family 2 protein [Candidatus Dormibacteraceae bacterium]
MRRRLAVLIPILDEERTLPDVLARVLSRPEVAEIVAIDDGSTDQTWGIVTRLARREPRLRALRQPRNLGKGAAVRRGLEEVTAPFAIIQDADLELDPEDYPRLLEPLLRGRADAVLGVRRFDPRSGPDLFVAGNRGLTAACNLLFRARLADVLCGYKLLPTELWRQVGFQASGFDIDAEVTARLLRLRCRLEEVPVSYVTRSRHDGKKIRWRDGLAILRALADVRVRSTGQLFDSTGQLFDTGHLLGTHPSATPLVAEEPS